MKIALIRIGNSQGLRLPKAILEQCGLQDEVELEVEDGRLVIHPVRPARTGWSDAFAAMARHGDDRLLDQPSPSGWAKSEWRW